MTRRYFKRAWSRRPTRNPTIAPEMYFIEYDFEDFIGDDDMPRVRITRKIWMHYPCDAGSFYEWQVEDYKTECFYPKKAAEYESKIRNTKYMARKVPTELMPWFGLRNGKETA